MAVVYKVQNMQLIADNIIPRVSEEDEVTVDHHSVVAVADLSVEVC
jgi:hypothetical protein